MKNILVVSALILLISGNALAGSEYDRCIKEEKVLRTQETSECSGLGYILNPSACFATRKKLKEFASGKCKKIGIVENVDFSVQTIIPEKKDISVASTKRMKGEIEIPLQNSTIEQLKAENARLKAEISRLKADNEELRKTGR